MYSGGQIVEMSQVKLLIGGSEEQSKCNFNIFLLSYLLAIHFWTIQN